MIVETKVIGQAAELADRPIELETASGSLRSLITELVRVEIDGYEQRRRAGQLLQVLTPDRIAGGTASGRISSGGRVAPPAPTLDQAIERAIEAFRDGLYFVFVDGRQIDELDAELVIKPDARIRLVRLVALAGG